MKSDSLARLLPCELSFNEITVQIRVKFKGVREAINTHRRRDIKQEYYILYSIMAHCVHAG